MSLADVKKGVIRKLEELYPPDDVARFIWYLGEEEKSYIGNEGPPVKKSRCNRLVRASLTAMGCWEKEAGKRSKLSPTWEALSTLEDSPALKPYADRILADTKEAEKEAAFQKAMKALNDQMLPDSDDPVGEGQHQGWDLTKVVKDPNLQNYSLTIGLARNWHLISKVSQTRIVTGLQTLFTGKNALLSADEFANALKGPTAGMVVMVALAAVTLAWEAQKNIRMYLKGEIRGKRCAKNIVDSLGLVVAGAGGSYLGALIGVVGGPIGVFVGGVIGGIAATHLASAFIDRLTQSFFGLPESVAVENAYRHLGVHMTATNAEVNAAFRQLCLKHHPDKGGKREEFEVVQIAMTIIREARAKKEKPSF